MNFKTTLLSLCILFSALLGAQNTSNANHEFTPPPPPDTVQTIDSLILNGHPESMRWATAKTPKHQRVIGTRVYLIPPPGLVASKETPGFAGEHMTIHVIETTGDIETQLGYFQKHELEKQGYTVVEHYNELKINQERAAYMRGIKEDNEAVMFLTGTSEKIVLIVVAYKNVDGKIAAVVKDCIASVYWDKDEKENTFEDAHFEIDGTGEFLTFMSKSLFYVYALKAKVHDGGKFDAFLMLAQSVNALYPAVRRGDLERQVGRYLWDVKNKGQHFEEKKYGYTTLSGGYRAYEMLCETVPDAQNPTQKGTIYVVLIETANYLYLLHFTDLTMFYEDPSVFRKIVDTFKPL